MLTWRMKFRKVLRRLNNLWMKINRINVTLMVKPKKDLRLHTENELPTLSGSALKVVVWVVGGVGGG